MVIYYLRVKMASDNGRPLAEPVEALRLVLLNLETIVPYLSGLQAKISTVFREREFRIYEVGVNVVRTMEKGSIDYTVNVFSQREDLFPQDVRKAVLEAEPDYDGGVNVISVAVPYPLELTLNLPFLLDIAEIQR